MDFFEIVKTIESVQHPAIATSLVNLGILQDIDIEGDKVTATFVWPFENIPIKQQIINSVKEPLEKKGLKFEYNERIMNDEERKRFLELEKKYWRGGQAACGG
jgi:metal-sulfur cluster biosynthetic enzyme